jgi:hypothetical protein
MHARRNEDIKIKEYNEKEIGRRRGDGEIEKKREREEREKGRIKGYLTGGKQELELHVDIKIERPGCLKTVIYNY